MTGRTFPELAQTATALARIALRMGSLRTEEEQAQAGRDQRLLMEDLDREEFELLAAALAALVAEIAEDLAGVTGRDAESHLDHLIARFAADRYEEGE